MQKKYKIAIAVGVLLSFLTAGVAYANPSIFAPGASTSAATSTPAFVGSGVATTTLSYDAYAPLTNTKQYAANKVGLLVQLAASSTATTYNMAIEYSQDGIDWYRNFTVDPNGLGTTTTPYIVQTPSSISWKFASSTIGGASLTNANSATSTAAFIIPTPFRFVRIVGTMTGGAGAVWMQFVPIKEVQ